MKRNPKPTLDEFLRSLTDNQLEGLCRFCGMPEAEIVATRFVPDTRSDYERLRDRWNDPEEAAALTRAGFDRERMLAVWQAHELLNGRQQYGQPDRN